MTVAISLFPGWDSPLRVHIKAPQCGLHRTSTAPLSKWTHRESPVVDSFLKRNRRFVPLTKKCPGQTDSLISEHPKCAGILPQPQLSGNEVTVDAELSAQAFTPQFAKE